MGRNRGKKRNTDVDINAEDAKKHGWAVGTAQQLAELGFLRYPSPQRSDHNYDGVLGEPPEWFPHSSKGDFLIVRDRVLDHHTRPSPEIAKSWIRAWDDQTHQLNEIPTDLYHEINMLWRFYRAYRLGEELGLNLLLGSDQAKALTEGKQRQRGRRTAGEIRRKQMEDQAAKTKQRVLDLEAKLRKQGVTSGFNKRIARELGLSADHIRKIRKKRT
jgi:hypothetical protein